MSTPPDGILWLGNDAGEQTHHFVLLDTRGKPLAKTQCSNRPAALRQVLGRWAAQHPQARIRVVTEACRGAGALLARVVVEVGLELWTIAPTALAAFRKSEGQPRKSDDWDAQLLARMGYLGVSTCRPKIQPTLAEVCLCRLQRLLERTTRLHTQAWHELRSRLLELHPALVDRSSPTPHYQSDRMLKVLAAFPGLAGIERASLQKIEALLSPVPQAQRRVEAQALQDLARQIEVPEPLRELAVLELGLLVERIDLLWRRRTELKRRVQTAVAAHPMGARLLAVPGVGPQTAAVLLGEILPLARQATEPQIATYSGLTPLCRRSGRSFGRDRLSRGTNKHVLRVLYLSATAARQCSALDQAYYQRQRQRHAGHPAPHITATLALARQRMKMLYRLLTTDAEYDPQTLLRSHLARRDQAA